jgi:pyruvate kinase
VGDDEGMTRRTKIVATIGPASDAPDTLRAVLEAGVDVVRLNLSHGTLDTHRARLVTVRAIAAELGRPIAVLADLPGPKLRAGLFPEGGVFLAEGQALRLVEASGPSSGEVIAMAEPGVLRGLQRTDRVILGDGAISLRVSEVDGERVTATVETGGRISGSPGVHLPSNRTTMRAPTEEDLVLLAAMIDAEVEYVALSFVRSADDLRAARKVLAEHSGPVPHLIAKIETAASLVNLEEILDEADGVMVARGDLGIECPFEDVPHEQKRIVRAAVRAGKPVITATQMLESMIHAPSPTRAEVTDVAHAVFDGTDAVMLSAETAIGHDPALVVATMARIAERAEAEVGYRRWNDELHNTATTERVATPSGPTSSDRITNAMANATCVAADGIHATAIVCCTRSGRTARAMARFRPDALLLGMSPSAHTVRQMALVWGVLPMRVAEYTTTDDMVWCVVETIVAAGHAATGDLIAVLAGAPDAPDGVTDTLRFVHVR